MGDKITQDIYLAADYIITSNGFGTRENIDNILNGRSGIRLVNDKRFSPVPLNLGLIDKNRLQEAASGMRLESFTMLEQLFIVAIKEIISQSGIDVQSGDCGLIISTTKGNISLLEAGTGTCDDIFIGSSAAKIAAYFHFPHKPVVISNACISGVSSVIAATRLMREGMYKHVIVAGGDVLSRFIVSGFQSLKSLSHEVCRPFDAARNGLTLGEGCAAALLTADSELARRGVNISIRGGGLSNDANHISGPSRTGDGLASAITQAISGAGISTDEIGFINSHGTATVYNDEMESKAYALAGLESAVVNGLKPSFGHTLGASGVIETILCAYQLRERKIYATKGFENRGVSNDKLRLSSQHTDTHTAYCLKTASGFGGCNAAVVLGIPESTNTCSSGQTNSIIKKVATIQYASANGPFDEFIRSEYKSLEESNLKFFKMDRLAKLGYVASCKLLSAVREKNIEIPENTAVILASRSGSLDGDRKYWDTVIADADGNGSPAAFVYTLANVVAGEICIKHKLKGEQTTFICEYEELDRVEEYAGMLLRNRLANAVLYGWCEVLGEEYEAEIAWIVPSSQNK